MNNHVTLAPFKKEDTLTINDMQQGRRVLKYHEHKIEKA
jgi:hypothetical protein